MLFYLAFVLLLVSEAKGSISNQYVTSNQCSIYQGGCKYQLVLARSGCGMSQDAPVSVSEPATETPTEPTEPEDASGQMKKLEELERKLVRMMEGLSVRSLRHIRQIKSDLREMTSTMNMMKIRTQADRAGDSPPLQCPPEFIGVGTWPSCYRFSTFNTTWHDAREYCSAFGANLVAMETMREVYILDYLIKSEPDFQEPKGWWTSGNFIVRSRRWMWTSKHHLKPMQYTHWAPQEPDARSSMHCMILYKPAEYQWHDATCTDQHSFICEIELV